MKRLEKLNLKLEEDRAKLQKREALAKALKIKNRQQNFMKIGELLERASIDLIEHSILLGAFMEISKQLSVESTKTQWKLTGEKILNTKEKLSQPLGIPLEILFEVAPTPDVKSILKQKKFKWNSTRKVWEGIGTKEEIHTLISPYKGTVKEI